MCNRTETDEGTGTVVQKPVGVFYFLDLPDRLLCPLKLWLSKVNYTYL